MNRIERIIDDINNDRTMDSTALYFQKGCSFYPMVFSENFDRDMDWSVSVRHEMILMLWLQYEVTVRQNEQNYNLKLTKAERKALAKAYDDWYNRQKEMHKRRQQEASQ